MSEIDPPPASAVARASQDLVVVWDPGVRVFHWSLVILFFIAYLTEEDTMTLHVWSGYLVGALVAARIVWGLVGPGHARFSDFVYSPSSVFGYLRDLVVLSARRYLGHSPAGGAMVVALLVAITAVVVSGIVLYGLHDGAGPLGQIYGLGGRSLRRFVRHTHELIANLTLALIVVHIGGVLLASFAHRENLIKAMFTGRKRTEN